MSCCVNCTDCHIVNDVPLCMSDGTLRIGTIADLATAIIVQFFEMETERNINIRVTSGAGGEVDVEIQDTAATPTGVPLNWLNTYNTFIIKVYPDDNLNVDKTITLGAATADCIRIQFEVNRNATLTALGSLASPYPLVLAA